MECEGVAGDNLAARALAEFRSRAGNELPPLAITIRKRVPVAAGLGGGSADAAAALRIANQLLRQPLGREELVRIAADLGSDVPSQLDPRHALVQGAGEHIEPVSLPPLAAVLIPDADGLSTAAVYAELDRLHAGREALDPVRSSGWLPPRRTSSAPRSTTTSNRPRSRCAPTSRSGSTP